MMVLFGLISTGLIVLLYFIGEDLFRNRLLWVPILGFGIEYIIGCLMSIIGYAILAKSWEGYTDHRFYQFIHYITIAIVTSTVPHGDFLLHLGYFHKGSNKRGLEEPFPDGFEIPKEPVSY